MRVECDLNTLVEDSLEQRKRQTERKRVYVQVALASDLPVVRVDRVGIEQVIANLVRNAADAMESHNNVRTIQISTKKILDASAKETMLEVSVRDCGVGLQGRTIDMLSSTFYSTKANGMGLGLGICRAIVESHGGKLRAAEVPEGGAELSFTIPVSMHANEKHL
jgi:two-component system sensor histidine kinase DctS